jgi:hypothetical protein
LQLFLYCRRDSFLVPFDVQAFGYKLSENLLQNIEKFNCNPTDLKIEEENKLLSDDKYGCLLQLCISHLIQFWPKNLPSVLFNNHIVPMLIINLTNCIAKLKERSQLYPLPRRTEVFKSSTSSIIALSSYLKAILFFIPTAPTSVESPKKMNGGCGSYDDNIGTNSENSSEGYNRLPLTPIGFGCSRLIKASSEVLSSMIFSCLSHIATVMNPLPRYVCVYTYV